jgi:short-subunit dehydrogenase
MKTQSMGLAVITGASSGIGVVYADRPGLNRQQKDY